MDKEMGFKFILLASALFVNHCLHLSAEPTEDKKVLLDFVKKRHHSHFLNWNENTSACSSWIGVTCNHDKSGIRALHLPGFGFRGLIPQDTLSRLSALEILSLRSNGFSGPFPSDFFKLRNLTALYLQSNKFNGPLPLDFTIWKHLSIIDLSENSFNGSIHSISNLTHLTALNLSNNSLSGEIPDLNLPSLQWLDLSNNNLTGIVPQTLQRFPSWAFSGNHLILENSSPLPSPSPQPNAQPSHKSSKLSEPAILEIIIGSCVLGFLVLAVLLIVRYSNKEEIRALPKSQKKESSMKKALIGSQDANGRLVFFEGCNLAFDLEDLLRASAKVLGKGTFGMTYKAAMEDATNLVVKRLKDVSVTQRDFEQQMEIIGNIRHENVAALKAYYYSKDEKLVVFDYYILGSMSAMLHANRGSDRIPLDWNTRVLIAIGTARGIAHIHTQNEGKFVHGNIKASNIFLNSQQYGCLGDLGLATLMSPMSHPGLWNTGYQAPEVTGTRKVSQASDVYSFGVLLLELLTGKSPIHGTSGNEVIHLVRWVHSVVREEWTAEVFDVELLKYPNIEEEMLEMLQIGMACAARVPEQRPKMRDVVKIVEDIRRVNIRNNSSSEIKSNVSTPTLTPTVFEIGSSSLP